MPGARVIFYREETGTNMSTKTLKRQPTTDAIEILHRRYFEGKPEMLAMLEDARVEDEIARKIYALRAEAG